MLNSHERICKYCKMILDTNETSHYKVKIKERHSYYCTTCYVHKVVRDMNKTYGKKYDVKFEKENALAVINVDMNVELVNKNN